MKSHWKRSEINRFSHSASPNFLRQLTMVADIFEDFEPPSKKFLATPLGKIVWLNEIWLRLENYQQGENNFEYLWFPILNSAFLSLDHHFSLFNYNFNENIPLKIFNSVILCFLCLIHTSSNPSIFLPA